MAYQVEGTHYSNALSHELHELENGRRAGGPEEGG